jgi:hypothetical protein
MRRVKIEASVKKRNILIYEALCPISKILQAERYMEKER